MLSSTTALFEALTVPHFAITTSPPLSRCWPRGEEKDLAKFLQYFNLALPPWARLGYHIIRLSIINLDLGHTRRLFS